MGLWVFFSQQLDDRQPKQISQERLTFVVDSAEANFTRCSLFTPSENTEDTNDRDGDDILTDGWQEHGVSVMSHTGL